MTAPDVPKDELEQGGQPQESRRADAVQKERFIAAASAGLDTESGDKFENALAKVIRPLGPEKGK